MTTLLAVRVPGVPVTQGSMALFRAKSGHEVAKYPDKLYSWRRTVTEAVRVRAAELGLSAVTAPVVLHLVFEVPRPAGHYGSGKNAGTVRAGAPCWPTGTRGDLDKYVRAIGDSITDAGAVWLDDAQVVEIRARKQYATAAGGPGVEIRIYPAEGTS